MAEVTPTPHISVEEYLSTVYEPECEYVDGVLEERNVGTRDHSNALGNVTAFFRTRYSQTGVQAWLIWRFQTSPTRYRVPDVILTRGEPDEDILTKPPLACIEVLSPEDRMSRVNVRIKEFLDFGVPTVWLIDPEQRRLWIYRPGCIQEATGSVKLDGAEIEVPFSEIFD
jgi:Uma2 family endonuclease